MSLLMLLGIVAAFWVYRDAQKFGYSKNFALLWAAGNIMMVAIFFPLYLLVGRKPQMKSNRRVNEKIIEAEAVFKEELLDCPMCARQVQDDFKVCPYCGYSLNLSCENCGQELKRESKICPHCQTEAPEK